MSADDFRARLQRLRPPRPPVPLPPRAERVGGGAAPSVPAGDSLEALPGVESLNALGAFQLIEARYGLDYRHGQLPFSALFDYPPAIVARLARAPALAEADLRGLAFLDTETTGLAGGAGTLAFLVGLGVFEGGAFVLRQYFLRGPHEEPAMLAALLEDLAPRAGWVTFNGRAFDVPILESRLTVSRLSGAARSPFASRGFFAARPHLDLLTPARWLYRGRLASCALSSLEQNVLGVPRTDDDVPGELIPHMYVEYLRTGDPREMRRVIYHNAMDILSMVTLAAHLAEAFAAEVDDGRQTTDDAGRVVGRPASVIPPPAPGAEGERGARDPAETLRLAMWHDREERLAEAEAAYRRALAGKLSLDDRQLALTRLAALLKRLGRRAEAVPLWEQLASFTLDDALPCIELSKYFEWKAGDPPQALAWARRAEAIINTLPAGWRKTEAQAAIERRLERLQGKLAR